MIIPQALIDKAAEEYYLKNYCRAESTDNIGELKRIFTGGTEFAEQELGNIAVKFASWLLLNAEMTTDSQGLYCYHRNTRDYTVEEIFKVFIEEEYGQI